MKHTYFMTVIDSVFCMGHAFYKQTRDVSVIKIDWSEIVGCYNTPFTVVRDRRII